MESDIIKRLPVHFVSTKSSRLSRRYSILVKQYSLSREAYVFWEQLKNSNEPLGTLFDKQPAQLISNIYNQNDPSKLVLGFFEASSVSTKRIFLTRRDIPVGIPIVSEFAFCEYSYMIIPYRDIIKYANQGYCMVNDDISETGMMGLGVVESFICCDCTFSGTNIKPDYW
jgi:hypothetical protein